MPAPTYTETTEMRIEREAMLPSIQLDADQQEAIERLRTYFNLTARLVNVYCPDGPDRQRAIVKLMEAYQQAIFAIIPDRSRPPIMIP